MALYVYELHWLASEVVRRADALFGRVPPPGEGNVEIDSSLHAEVYALLADAAKIRSLITERPRRRGQSMGEHDFLVRRAQALSERLAGLNLDTVRSVEARNSVEHFDERIDQTALRAREGTIEPPVHILVDLVVWSRGDLQLQFAGIVSLFQRPQNYPFRVYVASERRFLNADAEIDLGALRDECAAVRDRLAADAPDPEERGALVVVISRSTFR
jgi:hypothetical protein